ncbi:AlbA family DNA-binding domain-containing protein [Leptospira bandrabouensis]|uniref:ATP-binding protein n=1 Tax=Leptospira bandrabouensis TaxID=2484903 RepID=A0A6H3NVR9_9LEPT|nr:ATP-binding protein [Leptospira bandrabouensis]TGN09102.1 ATP-binding protein [Leptospira bandrabouensis]TGN14020.1 ATP-binding protein [Leptospira bandrabouensis]
MDDNTFQQFLYLSEGESLDFKRDQYKISKSSEDEKSEFVKDIVAMANSWRKTDAFIILGIKENNIKPNTLFGITDHIDDATFQQILNSKTNRPCKFSYETYTYQDLTFGIFRIPVQDRPIYLKKNFGILKPEVVYVKRGSSTAEASIDEISKMGLSLQEENKNPILNLAFFDPESENNLGTQIKCKTQPYLILDEIPSYFEKEEMFLAFSVNRKYYWELYSYSNFNFKFSKIHFILENSGNSEAKNIKIEIDILDKDIDIIQNGDEPIEPEKYNSSTYRKIPTISSKDEIELKISKNKITISSTIANIHAKDSIQLEGNVYINPRISRVINLNCKIYCDKIEKPFEQKMEIQFNQSMRNICWEDYKKEIIDN